MAAVNFFDHLAGGIHDHQVDAYRADIQPHVEFALHIPYPPNERIAGLELVLLYLTPRCKQQKNHVEPSSQRAACGRLKAAGLAQPSLNCCQAMVHV